MARNCAAGCNGNHDSLLCCTCAGTPAMVWRSESGQQDVDMRELHVDCCKLALRVLAVARIAILFVAVLAVCVGTISNHACFWNCSRNLDSVTCISAGTSS